MLHDLARLYPPERLLAESAARGLAIDDFARRQPIVLHAPLGAELARERYGVGDPGVLEAIRLHTLAGPGMSRLAAVVYLADGLEPGRTFAEREALERLAFRDLERATAAVIRSSLVHLQGKGLEPAPQTLAALRDYERFERSPLSA